MEVGVSQHQGKTPPSPPSFKNLGKCPGQNSKQLSRLIGDAGGSGKTEACSEILLGSQNPIDNHLQTPIHPISLSLSLNQLQWEKRDQTRGDIFADYLMLGTIVHNILVLIVGSLGEGATTSKGWQESCKFEAAKAHRLDSVSVLSSFPVLGAYFRAQWLMQNDAKKH